MDECEVGTLRSLGEGGYASEGSARRSVWRGATAVRPWGFTCGTSLSDNFRHAATYVDKILKVPGRLTFLWSSRLKAAKQIGLTIPPNVLARADKVIK